MPLSMSVSYGDNEPGVDFDYATRVNTEFQKAGARGMSIMFSSGDGGVSGGQSQPCDKFVATFPAGSPWVTAVGGTTLSNPEVAASYQAVDFRRIGQDLSTRKVMYKLILRQRGQNYYPIRQNIMQLAMVSQMLQLKRNNSW